MKDHIVDEIRRVRDEHGASFDYDVDAIFADLKRLEKTSNEPHVSFGPKRIAITGQDVKGRRTKR